MKLVEAYVMIFLLIWAMDTFGQQKPHYTQYLQNMQVINPAFGGIDKEMRLKTIARRQWMGLEGAPKTMNVSFSIPFVSHRDTMVTSKTADSLTRSSLNKEVRLFSARHHGLGILFLNDETGAFTESAVNISYAYHLVLDEKTTLSFGLGMGTKRMSLDISKLRFDDAFEPVIAGGSVVKWSPDLNAGLYVYRSGWFAGVSMLQAVKQKVSYSSIDDKNYKDVPHYFLTAGYQLRLDNDFSVTPSVMLKKVSPVPLSIDINMKVAYRNALWGGLSYRFEDAISAMMGLLVKQTLEVGYSYDFTQSSLEKVSTGTHEIMVGVRL